MNNLTPEKEEIIEKYYRDPKYGLSSAIKLYEILKSKGLTYATNLDGITLKNIKEWLAKQEVHQVSMGRHNNYNSFVAEGPLEQFQIDLIYMPSSWFNKGYKYLLSCVDVFSKMGEMIPMKVRDSPTTAEAIKLLFEHLGVPKTIYSDQGSEFKNKDVLDLLKKNNVTIIFALDHGPFIESFNKTMKNKMYKYMAYHDTDNWSDVVDILVDAYNDTPHSSTKIAPNKINSSNIMEARMNMMKRSKTKNYENINVGDTVRIPVIHKVEKGYKQQWSYELHKVEANNHNGTYLVNGNLYPRKELQLVKGEVSKVKPRPVEEQKVREETNRIGTAQNSKLVKELKDTQGTWTGKLRNNDAVNIHEPRQTRSKK